MEHTARVSKTPKVLSIVGSIILLVMALFHGRGYFYVSKAIKASNAEEFLKEIIPVLFAHPSLHLISLASFGVLALFIKQGAKKVLMLLSIIVFSDAFLAFYLDAIIPGVLLLVAALAFCIASLKKMLTQKHTLLK